MPRYFNNRLDGQVELDQDGSELPDLETVQDEAIIFLGHSIRDHPRLLKHSGKLSVEVTDHAGVLLTTVVVQAMDAAARS